MNLKRLAILSVHTSPLAPMGGKKTGGMNVYIRELAHELGQRGIHVDIFTRRSSEFEPDVDTSIGENVRVIYLSAGPIAHLNPDDIYPYLSQFTARLMAFTTRHNISYEMVYSHYWLSGWVAQKLKEAWGTPFVQMFHTLGQMKMRILSNSTIFPDQRISTESEIIRWAAQLVAATLAEHSQLLWLYRAKRRKIKIVPPGVDTSRFIPETGLHHKGHLGFAPHHQVLLFVGRIEPLKGVDTIIKALHVLRERDSQSLDTVRLAIVGGNPHDCIDPEILRLHQLVHSLDLEDYVQFLGARDQSELPMYYQAATAVIMPSDYESFGMVALEAMASGTPVIASEVGGLAYLVRDAETGFLIPVREPRALADCIEKIVSNSELSTQMGLRASHLAREYAWEKIADRLLHIFNEILVKKPAKTL